MSRCHVQVVLNRLDSERLLICPFHSGTDSGKILDGALDTAPTVVPGFGSDELHLHGLTSFVRFGAAGGFCIHVSRLSAGCPDFSVCLAAGLLLDDSDRTHYRDGQHYVNP